MKTIQVEVVSSEKSIFSGSCEMVVATADSGDLGISPGHAPLLSRLKPGIVRLIKGEGQEEEVLYVSGGMLEIQPHIVTILADACERAENLDAAAAETARKAAEKQLSEQKDTLDFAQVQKELAQAAAQLRSVEILRKIRKA